MYSQNVPKKQKLAEAFRFLFRQDFDEAAAADAAHFTITKQDFDQFLLLTGEVPEEFATVPEPGSGSKWDGWVRVRNGLRAQLNEASVIAMHGEPAYRIDKIPAAEGFDITNPNHVGQDLNALWVVQLKDGIAAVSFQQAMRAVMSLMENKAGYTQMVTSEWAGSEQVSAHHQLMMKFQQREIERAAELVAHILSGSLKSIAEVQEQVLLAAPKPKALPPSEAA